MTAAGVGVGVAVAAPVVIPAAVGALGFGAGGIAAGSTGAWLMSLGAGDINLSEKGDRLTILGMTPAAVSVLQSIGATGVISGSTAAITGTIGAAAASVSSWAPALLILL